MAQISVNPTTPTAFIVGNNGAVRNVGLETVYVGTTDSVTPVTGMPIPAQAYQNLDGNGTHYAITSGGSSILATDDTN